MANGYYSSAKDKEKNIYELQSYLSYISDALSGIPKVYPDGIYGQETTEAVRAFQKKVGLPQTGEADFETWEVVVETYDDLKRERRMPNKVAAYPLELPHLKEGDNFEEIYVLQIMLRKIAKIFKNITMPNLTGVYDDLTSKAVEDFSRIYGKESGGKVDRELWNVLTDTYNAFTYNG